MVPEKNSKTIRLRDFDSDELKLGHIIHNVQNSYPTFNLNQYLQENIDVIINESPEKLYM